MLCVLLYKKQMYSMYYMENVHCPSELGCFYGHIWVIFGYRIYRSRSLHVLDACLVSYRYIVQDNKHHRLSTFVIAMYVLSQTSIRLFYDISGSIRPLYIYFRVLFVSLSCYMCLQLMEYPTHHHQNLWTDIYLYTL